MRPARTLITLAPTLLLTAALAAGCGGNDSSSADQPAPTQTAPPTTSGAGLLISPVIARYATGVPLGPQIGKDQVQILSEHKCTQKPETLSDGSVVECDALKTVFLLRPGPLQAGVASAEAKRVGTGHLWYVKVQLDDSSTTQLAAMTKNITGSEIAVSFHGEVVAAPIVESDMTDGKISILGDYDQAAATKLASELSGS